MNQKYDHDQVIDAIVIYLSVLDANEDLAQPIEKLYSKIVKWAESAPDPYEMPKFSQARKMMITELGKYDLFKPGKGKRFTSKVAYDLVQTRYFDDDIEEVLKQEYKTVCYSDDVLICIITLPPQESRRLLASGKSKNTGQSEYRTEIKVIQNICNKIKGINSKLILAVIPEFSRMNYRNAEGKIGKQKEGIDPVCDTLCMFVKNTPDGKELVEEMQSDPQYFERLF